MSEVQVKSPSPEIGVYVHVPFCGRVCPYCDFAVVGGGTAGREAGYVAALLAELRGRAGAFAGRSLATLYFGGGTPSLLEAGALAEVLATARQLFPGEPAEVTLELNPSTTERSRLGAFREAGIDRLSIGIQSFADTTLRRLGRAHRAAECHETLVAARKAGFRNVSVDLIIGVAGQTLPDVLADVDAALAHEPEHLSAYGLTVEEGTPLAAAVARGRVVLPEDDRVADMMEALCDRVEAAGLERYEVSSYARPGHEARHNRRYWEGSAVLGVGVGAHSYLPPCAEAPYGARPANERDLGTWQARIEAGDLDPPEPGVLTEPEARTETMFLGLRRRRGLAADAFVRRHGGPPRRWFAEAIDELRAAALLAESADGDLALTRRGWLLSDTVFARFA